MNRFGTRRRGVAKLLLISFVCTGAFVSMASGLPYLIMRTTEHYGGSQAMVTVGIFGAFGTLAVLIIGSFLLGRKENSDLLARAVDRMFGPGKSLDTSVVGTDGPTIADPATAPIATEPPARTLKAVGGREG